MKYLMALFMLFFSVITLAQINTGGPDFPISLTVIQEGFPSLNFKDHQVAPVVIHDVVVDQYKVVSSSDLNIIIQTLRPESMAEVYGMLSDANHFIETDLEPIDGPLEVYGYHLPPEDPAENIDTLTAYGDFVLRMLNFYEIFSPLIGYPIVVLALPREVQLSWISFLIAHNVFGRNTDEVIYVPVKKPENPKEQRASGYPPKAQ